MPADCRELAPAEGMVGNDEDGAALKSVVLQPGLALRELPLQLRVGEGRQVGVANAVTHQRPPRIAKRAKLREREKSVPVVDRLGDDGDVAPETVVSQRRQAASVRALPAIIERDREPPVEAPGLRDCLIAARREGEQGDCENDRLRFHLMSLWVMRNG